MCRGNQGLRVRDASGERWLRVQAATNCHGISLVDLIVVMVKSFDTRDAITAAGPVVGAHTVASAKVQRIDGVLADPQSIERGMLIEQEHPVLGKVKLPNLPFRFSECNTTQKMPAPLIGQHNRTIAADLGYYLADVDTLVRDGVLCAEPAVAEL